MTALFVFIVAVILIMLIARYNESNKLFKVLFISLLLGMAGGAIAIKFINSDSKNDGTTQVAPMQASPMVVFDLNTAIFGDTLDLKSNPAGKEFMPPRDSFSINAPSSCSGEIRAQPINCSHIRGGPKGYEDSG
jgi:disulfide bond formation protein DsbB